MRNRTWVLVLAMIIGLLILGTYTGWRLTRANERIRVLLLSKVRPLLDPQTDIQKLELTLGHLKLKNVIIVPKNQSFTLRIKDVRIGYQMWSMLRHGFSPGKIAHEAIFSEPQIVFHQPSDSLQPALDDTTKISFKSSEVIETLGFVKRVIVKSGRIFYENSLGEELLFAHGLNGFLISSQFDSSHVRLDGKLFTSDENNLQIEGHVNVSTGEIGRAQIKIFESEPTSDQPLLLPNYAEITSGKLKGEILYKHGEGAKGELMVEDGAFSLKGADLYCEGMSFHGDIAGDKIQVQSQIKSFNGSPLTIQGDLENILNPQLNLFVESQQFDIPEFFRQAIPGLNLNIAGHTHLNLNIKGVPHNPEIDGSVHVDDLNVYGINMNRFVTAVHLQDSVFTLQGNGLGENALSLDLKGQLDLSQNRRNVQFDALLNGDLIHVLPPLLSPRVTKLSGGIELNVNGALGDLKGNLDGYLTAASTEGDSLYILPQFKYKEQNLNISVNSNTDFNLEGFVAHPFYDDYEWHLRLEGFTELIRPLFAGTIRQRLNQFDMSGEYDATRSGWDLKIEGIKNNSLTQDVVLSMQASSEKVKETVSPVLCNATILNPSGASLPIYSQLFFEDNSLRIDEFKIGQNVNLKGVYPYNALDSLNIEMHVSDFELNSLYGIFPGLAPYQTRLYGHAEWKGVRKNPAVYLDMQSQNGYFHQIGSFASSLQLKLEDDSLHYLNWDIYQNDTLFAQCHIHQSYKDSLSGKFQTEIFPIQNLVTAFTGKDFNLSGDSRLNVDITGTKSTPVLKQLLSIEEGFWQNHPFSELSVNAIDTLFKDGDLSSGVQYIDLIQMDHPKGLTVTAWGKMPHNLSEEYDFSILGRGNLLAFLSDSDNIIKSASGNGEFFVRLGGKNEEWSIGEARIELNQGDIELAGVVEKIEDLQGKIQLDPESQFLKIDTLSLNVSGGILSISNALPESYDQELDPIVLSALGMHVGIIQLQSSKKGLRVNFPGLMEDGDFGRLWFTGKKPNKHFLLTGPNAEPRLSGTILLSDAHITYPLMAIPVSTSTEGPDPIMDFLSTLRWDLKVVPDRDVHYVREVESAFGNIFVDLRLRDDTGGIFIYGQGVGSEIFGYGDLISTEGNLEFLDHYFRIERITLDYPRGTVSPMLAGRASTTVTDSLGAPATVWLNLTSMNSLTGLEESGGSLENLNVKFTTDNPNLGITEADLLASLGYSAAGFRDRAYDALGMQVENMLVRPIVKPIEKGIRHHLGLDLVRFSSMFSRNLVQLRTSPVPVFDPKLLLRSAKVMLGKYIAPGVFITYSGQVGSEVYYYYNTNHLGLKHSFSLEYSIMPDLFLEFEYMYDSQLLYDRREDKRVWIRHTFPF